LYHFVNFTLWNFLKYAEAVLKFEKLNTQSQQRGAVVQGRSLPPYRLRYSECEFKLSGDNIRGFCWKIAIVFLVLFVILRNVISRLVFLDMLKPF
jgi:hypothetical protein